MELGQYCKTIIFWASTIEPKAIFPSKVEICPDQHPALAGRTTGYEVATSTFGCLVAIDETVPVDFIRITRSGVTIDVPYPRSLTSTDDLVGPITEHFNASNPSTITNMGDPRIRQWLKKIF